MEVNYLISRVQMCSLEHLLEHWCVVELCSCLLFLRPCQQFFSHFWDGFMGLTSTKQWG